MQAIEVENGVESVDLSGPLSPVAMHDPCLYHAEMAHEAMFYPLGFPVRVRTNCAEALDAAQESWGMFERRFRTPPIELQLGVMDDGSTECPDTPQFRAHRGLYVGVAGPGNFCVNDVLNGFSFAWVTSAAVEHRSYLRYHFLESAAQCHIANRHSAPIHAGCVQLHGRGVLLCGESGAGKSSLSFACARAGWTLISDDASFLLHDSKGREVVGDCHRVRLRPSAVELFPEVKGRPVMARAGGKPSIELMTAEMPGMSLAGSTEVDFVVFLNRQAGRRAEVLQRTKDAARAYMEQSLSPIPELRKKQFESMERLLNAEVVELRYSDMGEAIERLDRLVREGR
jgi:hypothetical protein